MGLSDNMLPPKSLGSFVNYHFPAISSVYIYIIIIIYISLPSNIPICRYAFRVHISCTKPHSYFLYKAALTAAITKNKLSKSAGQTLLGEG